MYLGKWLFLLPFLFIQAIIALSLEILDVKCHTWACQPSTMRWYLIFYEVHWNFRSTTKILTRSSGSTSILLKLGRKCCHFFGIAHTGSVLPFFVHSMSLNIDMNMTPVLSQCRYLWICFLMSRVLYVPNELHCSGCQIQCFDQSVFVLSMCPPIWLPKSGCIWIRDSNHKVDSENAWTLILIKFAADHSATYFLTNELCSTPAKPGTLYESLRSISVCHLSLHRLYQIFCSWETSIHRHPFEVFMILAQSLVNWLRIATLSGESLRLWGSFTNLAQIPINSCSSSRWREILCKTTKQPGKLSLHWCLTHLQWQQVARSLILQRIPVAWSLILQSPSWWMFEDLADTGLHSQGRSQHGPFGLAGVTLQHRWSSPIPNFLWALFMISS